MPTISCRALLFDMDGVLIDSTPAVARVWRQWAIEHGFDPEQVTKRAHGRPSIATIRDYLPDADYERENEIIERREIEDLDGVVALPGARELLRVLPPDRWTIVTSATRPLAEVRIRAAGLAIPEHLVTANEINRGKPDPEPYLKAASLLGFVPTDCVVVEDVPAGICAGKAAGAKVIAVRTTSNDTELRAAGADWVVDSCASIDVTSVSREADIVLALAI
jgi:mannitol-1-/sugar-/sorbitol-6-phosphatase